MNLATRKELKQRAKAYGVECLASDVGLSRQALSNFFSGGDMKLSNFEKLLKTLKYNLKLEAPKVSTNDVFDSLKAYGAPLVSSNGALALTLEETLVISLLLSRSESRLTSVLPYVFVQKANNLDPNKLLKLLKSEKEVQLLGYYLELALRYRYRKPLDKLLKRVKRRTKRLEPLFLRKQDEGKEPKKFDRFDNQVAESWRIFTRDDVDSVVERCRKWERLNDSA